jgi:hypothetical protein
LAALKEKMKRYKNLGGKSSVASYELAKDYIKVSFVNRELFRYSNQSAGAANVRQMKTLAEAGKGLGTFIDANVKKLFDKKIR